jgi:hypothetical protein
MNGKTLSAIFHGNITLFLSKMQFFCFGPQCCMSKCYNVVNSFGKLNIKPITTIELLCDVIECVKNQMFQQYFKTASTTPEYGISS